NDSFTSVTAEFEANPEFIIQDSSCTVGNDAGQGLTFDLTGIARGPLTSNVSASVLSLEGVGELRTDPSQGLMACSWGTSPSNPLTCQRTTLPSPAETSWHARVVVPSDSSYSLLPIGTTHFTVTT